MVAREREWGRQYFDKFSPRAHKIFGIARGKAKDLGKSVGEEFLMWALLEEGGSPAIDILRDSGSDPVILKADIEEILPFGEPLIGENPLLTERARQAIEFADEEATLLSLWIGSEPLQLGIVRIQEGRLAEVLAKRGVTEQKVRESTEKRLSKNRP